MRKSIELVVVAAVLGCALLPGARPFAPRRARAAGVVVAGDVDCDGAVTATDALAGLRQLAGLPGGRCEGALADIDCSGTSDIADILVLRRYLAGLDAPVAGDCPAPGTTAPAAPTSNELIDAARAAGDISEGEAFLYHLLADLQPGRLPAQYHGTNADAPESSIYATIAAEWNTLSADEQAALRPYLLPPPVEGSWYTAAEQDSVTLGPQSSQAPGGATDAATDVTWASVGDDQVKVWWETRRPADATKAAAILQEVSGVIWPQLVAYMGAVHTPLPDAAMENSGGDGRFDIYLVHNAPDTPGEEPVDGYVSPSTAGDGSFSCSSTPSYMVLNSRAALTPQFYAIVAHEFMHAIQFTYNIGDCRDYTWMMESTATWAESWLYPDQNEEHAFLPAYLGQLDTKSLEQHGYKDGHEYGAYLFWYFVEHVKGLTNAVHDAWEHSSNPDSLATVNDAVSAIGGLKDAWAESAVYNWNRPPVDDFLQDDGIVDAANFNNTDVDVNGAPVTYPVPVDIGHLEQRHLHYWIGDGVKSLTFRNPFYGKSEPYARVQALVNIDGTWEQAPRDWTNSEEESFCLEHPDEKVSELVIIISNSDFTDRTHAFAVDPGEFIASPVGCSGLKGTIHSVVRYFGTSFTIDMDVTFEHPDDQPYHAGDRFETLVLVQSSLPIWHASGDWFGCAVDGTMTLDSPGSGTDAAISGSIVIDHERNAYGIVGTGYREGATFTITCNDQPGQMQWAVFPLIYSGGPFIPLPEEAGAPLDNEYTDPREAYGGTWMWQLSWETE